MDSTCFIFILLIYKTTSDYFNFIMIYRRYFTPKHRLVQVRPHMEYCSHLWAGAPQYQLEPFDRIQRRAIRIIGDPMTWERLDTLALCRDVSSLCVLFRIYHGECSEILFDLLPAAEFSNRTKISSTPPGYVAVHYSVRFRWNFLPRATELWNGLPAAVFLGRYDMGTFKKRVYLHLKGPQRTCGRLRAW